ncbi:MAG: heterodisulfide reductase-related iron-sulfur binding cluster [Desulfatiglandales bacterium]
MTPFRPSYWQISPVWLFYVLAVLAVAVFALGLYRHLCLWKRAVRGKEFNLSAGRLSSLILDGLLGRRIFLGDLSSGLMHALIFWGFAGLFVGTLLISADYWLFHFLKGSFYLWYSFLLEILGLMLTVGLLWALIRRYVQRVSRLERRPEDLLLPLWILAVAVTGFILEGSRIAAQQPPWASWSFVGHWLTFLWKDTQDVLGIYSFFWWFHAILSLGLIAAIPFSKLFHILAAPASVFLKGGQIRMLPAGGEGKLGEVYTLSDVVAMDACTRCGRCVDVCPSTGAGEPFTPRAFIMWARTNLLNKYSPFPGLGVFGEWFSNGGSGDRELDEERIWHCTTCRACLEVCPVYVATPDSIRQARSAVVEEGTRMPSLLAQSLKNVYKYNNPWEATKKKRANWSKDLEIPDLSDGAEEGNLCYFVGCTTSMDSRAQEIARSFVRILEYGKIPFGTLGKKEPCCGDIARRAGEDGLFEMKVEETTDLLDRYNITDLVTSSPHCFHTMKNEYPAFHALQEKGERTECRIRHYTEFLEEMVSRGVLSFKNPLDFRVTYHDPCYLGRHNRIFDAPRRVIQAIPGLELVEMAHNRADSLCCGGGGDRIWQEDMDGDPKMSEIRIREAAATGAKLLVTACPLCLIMLEDARKTAGMEETLQVMDLNELVITALGMGGSGAAGT